MSVSFARQQVQSARRTFEGHRARQAAEETKEAKLDADAAAKERSASSTSNDSSRRSRKAAAASKRAEARKAGIRAAKASTDASSAQKKLHAAEDKLRDEEAKESRKAAERRKQDDAKTERARKKSADDARRADQQRDAAHGREVDDLRSQIDAHGAVLQAAPWDRSPETITVLFITASPEDQSALRIDKEMREIQQRVQASVFRDVIRFEHAMATQVADLLQRLNETKPDVVHFSGHGDERGLVFEDADEQTRTLDNEELAKLLSLSSKRIRLAIFNSCNSAEQAERACWHLDAAIGMDETIDDEDAQVFAGQLYSALGFGQSLSNAFGQALLQVELEFGAASGAPRLHTADGIDPDEVFIVRRPGLRPPN